MNVLETAAKRATLTACQQDVDSSMTPTVSKDTAAVEVEDEIRSNSTDEADITQLSVQDGCTVNECIEDGEYNGSSATDAVTRLSRRKRQRLSKSGVKLL